MIRSGHRIISIAILLALCAAAPAVIRFAPPEFEGDYVMPSTTTPHPHQDIYEYLDVVVLLAALSLASYLALKKRSRKATFILMVLSLLYFGFWRKGCVCPIGAIQNVTLAIFDNSYAVPIAVLLFFMLPLFFTLFFGRIFCASVCPLGAIQDIVLIRPLSVPFWLAGGLRLLAYLYFALAILFAATGSAFLICRYDPFVAFFRFGGNINILIVGFCFLLVALFVGRPYCRFFCPYGVILRQLSRISKWRVTITPDECIQCRLCEQSCPFGAIRSPAVQWNVAQHAAAKKRLAIVLLIAPVLIFVCGLIGAGLKNTTSRMHADVRLAEQIYLEEAGEVNEPTDPTTAFRATGESIESLYERASVIREKFGLGGWLLDGFMGLVAAVKLASVSVWRKRIDYEADRAGCYACGRCYKYCPREHVRLSNIKEEAR